MSQESAMRSLTYDAYQQQAYVREFGLVLPDAAGNQLISRAGLSPFDIPEKVTVEVSKVNQCVFRFAYANDEPAQAAPQPIPGKRLYSVLLGKNTGKILEFRIADAYGALSQGPIEFDPTAASEWSRSLPTHIQKTSVRSAFLIRGILGSMPDQFRLEVLELLRTIRSSGESEVWR